MNRESKPLQRQTETGLDDAPSRRAAAPAPARRAPDADHGGVGHRIVQYFREVRQELAKVLWPRRSEVINYSTVVLTTLVLISLLIFGLNYLFARGVFWLYKS